MGRGAAASEFENAVRAVRLAVVRSHQELAGRAGLTHASVHVRRTAMFGLIAVVAVMAIACGGGGGSSKAPAAGVTASAATSAAQTKASGQLLLASTTTTQDSGLLDVLIPAFEQETGYRVKLIAGGSGQAIENGTRGDVDVLLVHSPAAEMMMVAAGDGIERQLVMHNDFLVVGPPADPAGVKSAADVNAAFRAIADKQAPFISRGDNSGTNVFELNIWKALKITPKGQSWYSETGQGQGATLQIASQRAAYALADRATFLAQKANLDLAILHEKSKGLLNVYHVIVVNPARHPKVNVTAARAWAAWITRPDVQAMIGTFGVDKYGEPLFFADAGKAEPAG
jgi:tungstate transport system substrate-binding protein